ncbi:MAG TPA: adventurous gliding motility TPR repeat lipoprotein GltE [Anaeromyxobacteraceae bacterium]|nr:adventurous gliding motility TPR repeat lipoprotein GltE [Anaeromyxobacteraceae bacterium]
MSPRLLLAAVSALAACATTAPRPEAAEAAGATPPAAAAGARPQPPASARVAPRNGSGPAPAATAAPARPAAADAAPAPDALSPRAQRLWDEALASLDEQRKLKVPTDWALVERKFRAVLAAADVAEAHFDVGVALEAQGRPGEAGGEYRLALELKPSLRQAAVNLAVLQEKAGDARGAAAAYAELVRAHPEDPVARVRLAALYRASGQLDEAWRMAREALQRDPLSAPAYQVLVRVAVERNQLDLARLVSLKARKLAPDDPDNAYFEGVILSRSGDEAGAKVQWTRALALRDDYLPARYALLQAAAKGEAWVAVSEQAQAILRARPDDAAVHLALGIAQRHLGKADDALASYARAEQLSGGRLAEVHLARGVLLMKVKSECEPAISEFDAFARQAGPTLAGDAPVFKLRRECQEILVQNRQAAEAAKELQREAERKATEDAARKPGAAPPGGAAVPTSAPPR